MVTHTNLPDFSKVVTITVGSQKVEFIVPEALLSMRLYSLDGTSLQIKCNETINHAIKLPDVKVDTWNAYLYWIYKGVIFAAPETEPHRTSLTHLLDLYNLAHRFSDYKLHNAVIDSVINLIARPADLPTDTVNLVWSVTKANCPLRTLVLDTFMSSGHYLDFKSQVKEFCDAFVQNVAVEGMRRWTIHRAELAAPAENPCRYHRHDEQHPKCEKLE